MPHVKYHVMPNPDGRWQVKSEDASLAWRIHDSRETALNEALNLVRAFGRGEIHVHDRPKDASTDAPA